MYRAIHRGRVHRIACGYVFGVGSLGGSLRLGEKQELFMRLLPRLIDKAHDLGFEIRGGDLFRDSRVHGKMGEKVGYSNANSCHKLKLAIDLLLFKNGEYLTETHDYKDVGEWWEDLHPLTCWGGRFSDGNHFSITHEGSK